MNLSFFGKNMIFDPIFLKDLNIFTSWKLFFEFLAPKSIRINV